MIDTFDAATAARTLLDVWDGRPRPAGLPVSPPDTDAAYAVQRAVIRELGSGAWKMALLAGRDRHAAALPGRLVRASGDTLAPLPQDACIEVETALILGADLHPGADRETVMAAIGEVRLCFEIVASRFADRTAVQPLEAMADAFSSGGIVLGDRLDNWGEAMAGSLGIRLWLDEKPIQASETLQTLDDALSFLSWLAGHAAEQGAPLRKGDVIITGARIGPLPLKDAGTARASAGGAGVAVRLMPSVPG
ncbi:fumarylacetoacetate hydrolase family protein [Paracoccus benzoatiresistens]|uniref:Fumarylacetoacetate hydrolase family protein n=1 Tax=Paracoccus benzoatiresistens TaxID=2997341 RepID=A0ABT4J648_9RHOB|nr:fumarylacetoacetate hydrolase family protein [Paracoccus sp. EF6]MCZ0962536.1 fumarylacetoacetate hydrolase family protein [Paracoccus sp. EF6]